MSKQIGVPQQAVAALEGGDFIGAIKAMRAAGPLDLKAAKRVLEEYVRTHPELTSQSGIRMVKMPESVPRPDPAPAPRQSVAAHPPLRRAMRRAACAG